MIDNPLVLLHLYHQKSENDYDFHLRLWRFIWKRIETSVNKIKSTSKDFTMLAKLYPCFKNSGIDDALDDFESLLKGDVETVFFS